MRYLRVIETSSMLAFELSRVRLSCSKKDSVRPQIGEESLLELYAASPHIPRSCGAPPRQSRLAIQERTWVDPYMTGESAPTLSDDYHSAPQISGPFSQFVMVRSRREAFFKKSH